MFGQPCTHALQLYYKNFNTLYSYSACSGGVQAGELWWVALHDANIKVVPDSGRRQNHDLLWWRAGELPGLRTLRVVVGQQDTATQAQCQAFSAKHAGGKQCLMYPHELT